MNIRILYLESTINIVELYLITTFFFYSNLMINVTIKAKKLKQNSGLKVFQLPFVSSEAAIKLTRVNKCIVCTFKLPRNQSQLS